MTKLSDLIETLRERVMECNNGENEDDIKHAIDVLDELQDASDDLECKYNDLISVADDLKKWLW